MAVGQSAGAGGGGLILVNGAAQLGGAVVTVGSASLAWAKAKLWAYPALILGAFNGACPCWDFPHWLKCVWMIGLMDIFVCSSFQPHYLVDEKQPDAIILLQAAAQYSLLHRLHLKPPGFLSILMLRITAIYVDSFMYVTRHDFWYIFWQLGQCLPSYAGVAKWRVRKNYHDKKRSSSLVRHSRKDKPVSYSNIYHPNSQSMITQRTPRLCSLA